MPLTVGPAGVWSSFDHLDADQVVAFARAAETRGYDAIWTQETAGRDPFALLGHLAAQTTHTWLGVGIAVIYGRDPVAIPLTPEGRHANRATMEALAPPW